MNPMGIVMRAFRKIFKPRQNQLYRNQVEVNIGMKQTEITEIGMPRHKGCSALDQENFTFYFRFKKSKYS